MKCADTGCTDRCLPKCGQDGICSVGRKHYIRGGVSCMGDSWDCDRCGAPIEWGSLHDASSVEQDDTWLWWDPIGKPTEAWVCHCCAIDLNLQEKA